MRRGLDLADAVLLSKAMQGYLAPSAVEAYYVRTFYALATPAA